MTAVAEIAASSALNVDPLIRIPDTAAALPFSPYSSCFGEWIQPKEGTIERHDYRVLFHKIGSPGEPP